MSGVENIFGEEGRCFLNVGAGPDGLPAEQVLEVERVGKKKIIKKIERAVLTSQSFTLKDVSQKSGRLPRD